MKQNWKQEHHTQHSVWKNYTQLFCCVTLSLMLGTSRGTRETNLKVAFGRMNSNLATLAEQSFVTLTSSFVLFVYKLNEGIKMWRKKPPKNLLSIRCLTRSGIEPEWEESPAKNKLALACGPTHFADTWQMVSAEKRYLHKTCIWHEKDASVMWKNNSRVNAFIGYFHQSGEDLGPSCPPGGTNSPQTQFRPWQVAVRRIFQGITW